MSCIQLIFLKKKPIRPPLQVNHRNVKTTISARARVIVSNNYTF